MKKIVSLFLLQITLAAWVMVSQGFASVLVFEPPNSNGYSTWNDPANLLSYNDWLLAIGESPDFGENFDGNDWNGNPWSDGKVFDVADEPTAIFDNNVTFSNVGADSEYPAMADNDLGGTNAIGTYGWKAHESGISTMLFGNGADYIGFYIVDTGKYKDVVFKLTYEDNTTFTYNDKGIDDDRYKFIGFVNQLPNLHFKSLEITASDSSRYGIDQIEWGNTTTAVPEPATVALLGMGLAGFGLRRKKKSS